MTVEFTTDEARALVLSLKAAHILTTQLFPHSEASKQITLDGILDRLTARVQLAIALDEGGFSATK